jgi:hypothetical protein
MQGATIHYVMPLEAAKRPIQKKTWEISTTKLETPNNTTKMYTTKIELHGDLFHLWFPNTQE